MDEDSRSYELYDQIWALQAENAELRALLEGWVEKVAPIMKYGEEDVEETVAVVGKVELSGSDKKTLLTEVHDGVS